MITDPKEVDNRLIDLGEFLKEQISVLNSIRNIPESHCLEVASAIRKLIGAKEMHYTASGLRMVIPWSDGRDYEVMITPVKEPKCPE